jgi:hypothetical protein
LEFYYGGIRFDERFALRHCDWLVLAWRNAGWIGLDRWLLPIIGTPWKPGRLFHESEAVTMA